MYENYFLMMMSKKESHDKEKPQRVTESIEPPPFNFVSHIGTGRLQSCIATMCEQSQKLASVFLSLNIPPLLKRDVVWKETSLVATGLMEHDGPQAGLEHTAAIPILYKFLHFLLSLAI